MRLQYFIRRKRFSLKLLVRLGEPDGFSRRNSPRALPRPRTGDAERSRSLRLNESLVQLIVFSKNLSRRAVIPGKTLSRGEPVEKLFGLLFGGFRQELLPHPVSLPFGKTFDSLVSFELLYLSCQRVRRLPDVRELLPRRLRFFHEISPSLPSVFFSLSRVYPSHEKNVVPSVPCPHFSDRIVREG